MKLFIMTVKLFIIGLVIAVLAMDITEGATGDVGQTCQTGSKCGTNAACNATSSTCACKTDYSPDPNNAANCLMLSDKQACQKDMDCASTKCDDTTKKCLVSDGQACMNATQCASNKCENKTCEKSMGSRGAVESVVLMMSVLVISRFL